jgi:hypothetical protein
MMKDANPKLKIAFAGPLMTVDPGKALRNFAVDFVVRLSGNDADLERRCKPVQPARVRTAVWHDS